MHLVAKGTRVLGLPKSSVVPKPGFGIRNLNRLMSNFGVSIRAETFFPEKILHTIGN